MSQFDALSSLKSIRPSDRRPEQLREVTLETGVTRYAEGSCMVTFGHTKVLVTASVETLSLIHI